MRERNVYYRRLIESGKIIREFGECTRLQLARELEYSGIPTTPWTIDKIRNDILEMYLDIEYNRKEKLFYTYTTVDQESFSLSKNGELGPKTQQELIPREN